MWGALFNVALAAYQKDQGGKQSKAQKAAQRRAEQLENERISLARKSDARGEEQYARYMNTFVPLQDELIREAKRPANPDVAAGQATADVEDQLATARGSLSRQIGRRGINPADGAVIDAEARLALAGGKARAGAATMARRQAVSDRNARIAAVAGMGQSLPGTAYNFSAQAGGGLSDALNYAGNDLNYQRYLSGQTGEAFGNTASNIDLNAIGAGLGNGIRKLMPRMFLPRIDLGQQQPAYGAVA